MTQTGQNLKMGYHISGLTAPGWSCSFPLKADSTFKVCKSIAFEAKILNNSSHSLLISKALNQVKIPFGMEEISLFVYSDEGLK